MSDDELVRMDRPNQEVVRDPDTAPEPDPVEPEIEEPEPEPVEPEEEPEDA